MDSRQLGLENAEAQNAEAQNAEAQNAEAQNASNDGQQMTKTKTNVKMPWTNFIKYFTSVIYECL